MKERLNGLIIIIGSSEDGKRVLVRLVWEQGVTITTDPRNVGRVVEPEKKGIIRMINKSTIEKYYARYPDYEISFKTAEIELNAKCWYLLKELRESGKLNFAHYSNAGIRIPLSLNESLFVEYTNSIHGDFVGTITGWTLINGIQVEPHYMKSNVMASKINPSPIESIYIGSLYRILKTF